MPPQLRITQHFRNKLEVESLKNLKPQDLSDQELVSSIAEIYTEWSREYRGVPEKSPSTLRPVLTPSQFSQLDEVILAARSTLLCDSVAVAIPDTMSFALRFFRIVVQLEPAIDADLVMLVPEGLTGRVDKYTDAWFRKDHSGPPQGENERRKFLDRFAAGTEVAWNLDLCSSFPDKFDLACMTPSQTSLIREILQASGDTIPSSMVSTHDQLRYLHRVVSVPFPMLELPVADMIRVRQDGVFDAWREAVSLGFEKINNLDQDQLLDPTSVQLTIISKSLEDTVDRLRLQLNRSNVLRNSIFGSTGFALSAACGALGSTGGPLIGAASAGAGFLVELLIEWLGGRPGIGERAFKRLIVQVFGDPTAR